MRQMAHKKKRVVIKIGSNVIASRGKGFDEARMASVAEDIAAQQECEFLLVSSGAIRCGVEKLGWTLPLKTLPMKQAAAAVGQSQLMWAYERLFGAH